MKENQTVNIKFDFLTGGKFNANIIKDGKDQFSFENEILEISTHTSTEIIMAARGGFVISVKKIE